MKGVAASWPFAERGPSLVYHERTSWMIDFDMGDRSDERRIWPGKSFFPQSTYSEYSGSQYALEYEMEEAGRINSARYLS